MTESSQQHLKDDPLPRSREAVDWWLEKWGRQEVVMGNQPLTLVAWRCAHYMAVLFVFNASIPHNMVNNTIGNGVARVKGQVHISYGISRTPVY